MRGASWRSIKPWRPDAAEQVCRRGSATRFNYRASIGRTGRITYQPLPSPRFISNVFGRVDKESPRGDHEDQAIRALLIRAPHGITTPEHLAFESDLGHLRNQGSRLTDLPVNRQDLDLWLVLLEYRVLIHGERGIQDILYGMRFRGTPVKLLEYDDASDRIWDMSLAVAAQYLDILYRLCNPRDGIGRDRPTLFLDVVTFLLKARNVRQAETAATLLCRSHFRGREDLLALFDLVLDETCEVTLDDFCAIHRCLPSVSIYSDTVPALCKIKSWDEAFRMHAWLLKHHDFPKKFEHIELLVRQIAHDDHSLQPFLTELESFGLSFSAQARHFFTQAKAFQAGATMEAIDLSSFDRPSIRQRRLNDQFVAKIFATHALSFEFALKSLKFFGLVEVGPLAVREIAASAKSIDDLTAKFKMLEVLEIDTGSSVFVTVVKNLCAARSGVLLKAVLDTDQHHDVFEDQETQRRLLAGYYYQRDWPQVNRTLAILNRGKTGPGAQHLSQQLLLRSATIVRDWRGALIQLSAMHQKGHKNITKTPLQSSHSTFESMVYVILSEGKQSNPLDTSYLDRIRYLIGLLQDMEFSGVPVGLVCWRRVLFRLGELSWFGKVESLSIWLATYLRKTAGRKQSYRQKPTSSGELHSFEDLFDTKFQAAVMQWSICRSPPEPQNTQAIEQGRRGVRLLYTLSEISETQLELKEMRELFQIRLQNIDFSTSAAKHYMQVFDDAWVQETHDRQTISASQQNHRSPFFQGAVGMG